MDYVKLIADNWVAVGTAVITIASFIVKCTPNTTDNKKLEKFVKFFEKLSLNTPPINK